MSKRGKRTKGIEEAHPFAGTPALHHTCPGGRCQGTQSPYGDDMRCKCEQSDPERGWRGHFDKLSAGIGAEEIVACVAGDETTQIVIASRYSFGTPWICKRSGSGWANMA